MNQFNVYADASAIHVYIPGDEDKAKTKRLLWRGRGPAKPSVWIDANGGIRFRYTAYMHAVDTECVFPCWSCVGQKYRDAFKGFFKKCLLGHQYIDLLHGIYNTVVDAETGEPIHYEQDKAKAL